MPKTKGGLQSSSQSSYGLVPTESPVPGLSIELATLLVQAIKARRKYLSKSSSQEDGDDAGKIQNLQNTADDKTTLFLNELKRQVEHSSSTAASSKSSSRSRKVNKSTSDAPTHCLSFLLETLSDGTNSFHLRRSALTLMREILERSSDARIFLASGQHLLDFVSIVERVENDQSDVVEEEAEQNAGASSTNRMSPKSLFQLEAIELIHNLASRFGQFYTQFTVASRLLGDVSVNFSMHNNTNNNSDEGRRLSQSQKVRILRRDRDNALEYGPRACKSIEKMISRADEYFRVLVPRFGGFNTEEHLDEEFDEKISATIDSKPADESGLDLLNDMKQDVNQSDDIDDDDSIDWEEGDVDVSDLNDTNDDTNPASNTNNDVSLIEHQAAVAHTLDIMGRSGALLDGTLAVKVPDGNNSMEGEATAKSTQTPSGLAATTDQGTDLTTEARQKLQKIVQKSSTSRLPRLHRWIHALSYADGMQERAVVDPATASVFGSNGPVSLVLLPEDKRTLRGQLLQQMIKLKGEVEGVLQSAASLGIRPEAVGTQQQTNDTSGTGNTLQNEVSNSPRVNSTVAGGRAKRQWMPGAQTTAATKRKKSKPPRIKVIYRKK